MTDKAKITVLVTSSDMVKSLEAAVNEVKELDAIYRQADPELPINEELRLRGQHLAHKVAKIALDYFDLLDKAGEL